MEKKNNRRLLFEIIEKTKNYYINYYQLNL